MASRKNPNDGRPAREPASTHKAREQAKDREVIAILTHDGGGVADQAEMQAEYRRLLSAGWKP
jgi:hypothetical protein